MVYTLDRRANERLWEMIDEVRARTMQPAPWRNSLGLRLETECAHFLHADGRYVVVMAGRELGDQFVQEAILNGGIASSHHGPGEDSEWAVTILLRRLNETLLIRCTRTSRNGRGR